MSLIERENSALLLVDVQEKLTPFVQEHKDLITQCNWLLKAAKKLQIPILISEQYPQGLGHTLPSLAGFAEADDTLVKVHFSCSEDAACQTWVNQSNKQQIVLIGIETHICILQTALGFAKMGKQVYVVADCTSSRTELDKQIALDRMRHTGVHIVSKEMVFFEWLKQAGTREFKTMSREFFPR